MTSTAGKWIKIAAIVVLMAVVASVVCVLLLLKTGWLFGKIEQQVKTSTGYELKLPDRASLSSVFPRIGVTVPTAVVRASDANEPVQRVRATDVEVSLPFSHLTDHPLNGLTIHVGSLTTIVDSRGGAEETTSDDSPIDLPVVNVENLLEQMLSEVSDANLSVSVDELQIIARDASGSSSTYESHSNQLVLTPENLQVSGVLDMAESEQSILLQHHVLDTGDGFSTRISIDITSDAEEPRLYSVSSQQSIRGEEIDVQEFTATGPNLNVSGELQLALLQRFRLGGTLDIRQLELADLPVFSSGGGVSAGESETVVLFTDDAVDPGQYADIDLSVSLGAVRFNNQPVISGDIQISGSRERVTMQSDQLLLLGGQGQFNLNADASGDIQRVTVNANIEGAQLSRLQITQDEKLLFPSGDADLKVSMRTAGSTQKDLARLLNGYIMFASSDVELSQRYAEQLDQGIVSFVLKSIDKFRKNDQPSAAELRDGSLPLSCASLKLIINDGRVEVINGLIVDLPDNVLISSGFVDLHSETLGFAFRTKNKRMFDWSALSLVKFVELGGKLAEPRLSLDRKALIKQGLLTSSSVLVGALPPLVYRLADAGMKSGQQIKCAPRLF